MLIERLTGAVRAALESAQADGSLPPSPPGTTFEVDVEAPRDPQFGDYATSAALRLARARREAEAARAMADVLAARLTSADAAPETRELIASAEAAGGGFVNLRLTPTAFALALSEVRSQGAGFGRSDVGQGSRVLVEFVSANPNGPVTVAHGRGGAIGDVLATLFTWTGWDVHREFYVNDATNSLQMRVFARSVFARYRQLLGHGDTVPEDGYPGEYVRDIAHSILEREGNKYEDLPAAEAEGFFQALAMEGMLEQQKKTLASFGIRYDTWFSEEALHRAGAVRGVLEALEASGHAYLEGGALWLRSTAFGDDKDRVLRRADGSPTYIAGDLAYHKDKFDRGFDRAVDVWGADHNGYVGRTKAGIAALGFDPGRLHIALYQLVRLIKDGVEVKMGKRAGNIVTLEELVEEVGRDAARFFYLMRSSDAPLDFDIDLARRQDKDNPVYYVQYAHARCCSAREKARELGVAEGGEPDLTLLSQPEERALIKRIDAFPAEVRAAAAEYAPHRIARYAQDLAAQFHAYYDRGNRAPEWRLVRPEVPDVTAARLALADAVRQTLANALTILGIAAPERMGDDPDQAEA
jgi:arginyl-tRNA synthetase